jgi:hypothetical protein
MIKSITSEYGLILCRIFFMFPVKDWILFARLLQALDLIQSLVQDFSLGVV